MQVSVETTQGLERRMTIALPAEEIDSAVHERLQSLSKTARLNGFRPGKVPFKVIKKRYEPQVRSEVLGIMINRSYVDAVEQEKLRPAGQPDITLAPESEKSDDVGFSFVATFEVYPEFEPVFNDSLSVTRPVATIEQSDIDQMLENLRKQRIEYEPVERESCDGDELIVDFVGRVDGEEFEGSNAEDTPLVLGSDTTIPGFESQLLGLKAGEEKTITVTFPEDYGAQHLAGKEAEFDITVNEVRQALLPDFDEELIRSFGIEDGTMESLQADIRRNMERELKQRVESRIKSQVLDGLAELNPIDVPAALVAIEVERQKEQFMQRMPAGSDASNLPDNLFSEPSEKRVRLGLIIGEIIKRNELKADAEAVRKHIEELASAYQDPQALLDHYYGDPETMKNVESLVLEQTVIDTVLRAATVVDEPTTFNDIINPPAADKPADESEKS